MIRIENIVLGMCATNCYAVFDGGAKTPGGYVDDGQLKEAVIIDPAADAACIEAMIARYKLKPVAVLLTHGHFDHIMAAKKVKEYYQIPVYAGIHEEELLADKKELAEHNMLVDLGRNDLGKISKFGSVKVEKLHSIERYSHVMHIGSTVRGEIDEKHDALDAIEAVLPAGTLSGAPKIRACQLIGELENNKRGIYGGAIGYIDFTGNMDTCIAIRIAYRKNGKVFVRSGAGIVADSDPKKEFEECLNKARAALKALEMAQEEEL